MIDGRVFRTFPIYSRPYFSGLPSILPSGFTLNPTLRIYPAPSILSTDQYTLHPHSRLQRNFLNKSEVDNPWVIYIPYGNSWVIYITHENPWVI